MSHPRRPVLLLTGASTGLGLEIARLFLAAGTHHLVLTARASSLSRFGEQGIASSDGVWLRPLDVTDPDQRAAVVTEINANLGGVDVLINNAGVSYRSVIEHVTEDERKHQMAVNYHGPMGLCREVLPAMRARGSGRIVQVSSAGGMMAMPTMGVYAASKFALEAATEALYYEVKPFGIGVHLVLPGFIDSEGIGRVLLSGQSQQATLDPADPYHAHYQHMAGFVTRISRLTPASSHSVANKVVRVANGSSRRLRVPGTWDTHLLWLMRRYMPQVLYHALLYALLPGVRGWGRRR